jgi:hypothetical protein
MLPRRPLRESGKAAQTARNPAKRDANSSRLLGQVKVANFPFYDGWGHGFQGQFRQSNQYPTPIDFPFTAHFPV